MQVTINREMSITRNDFFRILPKALDEFTFEIHEDRVLCKVENGLIEISLSKGENRNLGALQLPVMHVNFILNNISQETQDKFFAKFELAYQKGGG